MVKTFKIYKADFYLGMLEGFHQLHMVHFQEYIITCMYMLTEVHLMLITHFKKSLLFTCNT